MGRLARDSVVQGLLDDLPATTPEGGSAGMLPRSCYTSPEFFEFEREAVFARSWICAVQRLADPQVYRAAC